VHYRRTGEIDMGTQPTQPDPFDELRLDEDFLRGGPREGSADERVQAAQRIARANNRLRAAGEIADGSGKPGASRRRRALPWIAIGAGVAIVIVLVAVLAS